MIAICVGTDLYPSIALAYERPESDIMRRAPRHTVRDRMVNARLMSYCYGQIGWIQSLSGMLCYFIFMNDYGFKPHTLPFINFLYGFNP